MPHAVRNPRSSPCSTTTGAGESSPSVGEGNAYDLRYTSDSNDHDTLDDSKLHVHQLQPIHSSSRSWRHCPSSRLSPLTRRQNTISSDTSILPGDSSQAFVSSPHDIPESNFADLKTATNRVSSSSPVSASDILILSSSSPFPSPEGGRPSATGPANTRRLAQFVSRLIPIPDATSFSSVQSPSAQKPSLLLNLSRSPTLTSTSLASSSTSDQIPQRDSLNTTSGSLTTSSPNQSTTVQTISSALTGLSTGFSVTPTTLPTIIQDSTSMNTPPFSTIITGPPSNSSMVSTPTTSGPSSPETLTTIEPTLNLTSDSRSTSVIASSTFVPITTFNISSSVTETSSEPMTSSSEDHLPTSNATEFITETSSVAQLPTERPAPVSIPHTSIRFVSTSTYTSYQTITNGPTITYTTLAESGVLISDRPRPDDNAFAHNTGAIIGVAVSAAFVALVVLTIVFLSCQRYKRNRERERGNTSRESFLRRELELDPDILSRPGPDNVTLRQPGSISFNLSPNDGRGGVGGSDENVSTESADMYPVQSHASPPVGGMNTYGLAPTLMPGSSGVPSFNSPYPHNVRATDNITRSPLAGSPTMDAPMGSPTQTAFSPTYVYPYENSQQTSGLGGATGTDSCADTPGCAVPSTSGHGYYSTDGHTTPACLGSSSHGHTVSNFGVLSSSSGHARSMSTGGMLASSSEHGMGSGKGISSPWHRSKSVSSFVERRGQAPPSSYIPPRGGTGGGDSTESSRSNPSSARSLFGKFRSMRKLKKERKEELNRRLSLQSENIRASMAQSSRESVTMSMGHGSILGHTAVYRPPSSLLNPPNPPLVTVPPVPPVPILQYPATMAEPVPYTYTYTSQPLSYPYVPPLPPHNPRYSIGVAISDSPYLDAWPPPNSPSLPSLVPTGTDASSYVEGLLNPNMLPKPSGYAGVPGVYGARGGGVDDRFVNGSKGGEGMGRYSLWMNEYDGRSEMSLRDHVDYSRPISGAVAAMGTMTSGSTPTFVTDRDIMEEAREGT